jgi:hypothetical protein
MTTEERFERIEHVTAGFAEERRKDREEARRMNASRHASRKRTSAWAAASKP